MKRWLKSILVVCSMALLCLISVRPLKADQTLTVTGTVAPKTSDFSSSISSDATGTVNPNTAITYTLTYSSHLLYASDLVVEAQWYQGTISGSPTPSVDIVDYVPSSATNGYNSTIPTVDLVNHTIRWAIHNFPASSSTQTLTFRLQTNSSYTGTNTVSFPVAMRLTSGSFTSADKTITNTYVYVAPSATPTPSPTPVPTQTPAPTSSSSTTSPATPTPIPTTTPSFSISSVGVSSITNQQISITVNTTTPTTLLIHYGTNQHALNQTLQDTSLVSKHIVSLPSLVGDTVYYVQISATDSNQERVQSDIFRFKTAAIAYIPTISFQSVTFLSSTSVLYVPTTNSNPSALLMPLVTLPESTQYYFRFQLSNPVQITRAVAIVRNATTLGITSAYTPPELNTQLIETKQGLFEGNLRAPKEPGKYEVFVRLYTTDGGITETKLANLHVTSPILVTDLNTHLPIEKAQVLIQYFSAESNSYLPLPAQLFDIKNPGFTDLNGELSEPLPPGKYRLHVIALGYQGDVVDFEIGTTIDQNYPHIELRKQPRSLLSIGHYYTSILTDSLQTTKSFILDVSNSNQFFELNALVALFFLVILTFFSFAARLHVPAHRVFDFLRHRSLILSSENGRQGKIKGRVFDHETATPLQGAQVVLFNERTHHIVSIMKTSAQGDFSFIAQLAPLFSLKILKEGYAPISLNKGQLRESGFEGYLIFLSSHGLRHTLVQLLWNQIEHLLGMIFEALLLLSLILEISLGYTLGWSKALPFICCSVINLWLWMLHLTHIQKER